jgi:hypothetical protein
MTSDSAPGIWRATPPRALDAHVVVTAIDNVHLAPNAR